MELNFEEVKVLLVDDDENFAYALKALLKSKGLEIESYSNPEKALEELQNNKFDMILLDYYMPEMTGEQFLKELRTFDKETIVFLQTAFSEEKPQLEMLKSLNIQGYIDKNKDPNDIFLDIVSGIKMVNLLKLVIKQQKEISVLDFKKAIIGDLITQLVNESKDQLFQIGTMVSSIENDTTSYNLQVKCIKNATDKINKLYDALNFEIENDMAAEEFTEIIKILLKAKLLIYNASINFGFVNVGIVLSNVKNLVYIVVKAIEEFLTAGHKEMTCEYEEFDNYCLIKIYSSKINFDIQSIKDVNNCNNIVIEKNDNSIMISVYKEK